MITSGGPRNSKPGTLNQLFCSAVQKYDKPDALLGKVSGAVGTGSRLLQEQCSRAGMLLV